MKKIFKISMLLAMLISAPVVSADELEYIKGDINLDKVVNDIDLEKLKDYLSGNYEFENEEYQKFNADLNGDEKIDDLDVKLLDDMINQKEALITFKTSTPINTTVVFSEVDGQKEYFLPMNYSSYSLRLPLGWLNFTTKENAVEGNTLKGHVLITKDTKVLEFKLKKETEIIKYETETIKDEQLKEGTTKVVQEGIDGKIDKINVLFAFDGVNANGVTNFTNKVEPVNEKILQGTLKEVVPIEKKEDIDVEDVIEEENTDEKIDETEEKQKEYTLSIGYANVLDKLEELAVYNSQNTKIKEIDIKNPKPFLLVPGMYSLEGVLDETNFTLEFEIKDKDVSIILNSYESLEEVLKFDTQTIDNNLALEGEDKVLTEGVDGYTKTNKISVMVDGNSFNINSKEYKKEPVNEVISVGTQKENIKDSEDSEVNTQEEDEKEVIAEYTETADISEEKTDNTVIYMLLLVGLTVLAGAISYVIINKKKIGEERE